MDRRMFVCGAAAALAACRHVPTDINVGPGLAPAALNPPDATRAGSVAVADDTRFDELRGFCDGIAAPDAAEHERHVQRLQAQLAAAGHAAFVTESGATMTWLSGVQWGRSERPFLLVVPVAGEPWFLCPAFEEATAREQLGDATVLVWEEHEDPHARVADALPAKAKRGRVALDGELRTFIGTGLSRAHRGGIVDGQTVVDACRMIKSEPELARLRRANEATKAALRVAAAHVTEGMTQTSIADLVRTAQQVAGLDSVWVLALVGPSAAYPHGTREDRVVNAGELVLVDTGGGLHGYRSDITRTWALGTPSDDAARAWRTVAQAQAAALAIMRPGARCADIDAAARAVIAQAGFGEGYAALTHRLGHGIGLAVHEAPYLRPDNPRVLAPGMTMSNEPGIYRRGEFGVRIEDIVAITEAGHEVFGPLSRSLDDPFKE